MIDNIKELSLCSKEVRSYGLNPVPYLNMPVLDLSIYEFYLANPNQKFFYTLFLDEDLTNIDNNYDSFRNFGFNTIKPDYNKRDFVLALDNIPENNQQFIVDIATYILCYIPKGFHPNKLYIREAVYYSEVERATDVEAVTTTMRQSFELLDAVYYLDSTGELDLNEDQTFDDIRTMIITHPDLIESTMKSLANKSIKPVTAYKTTIPTLDNEIKYKTIFDAEKIDAIYGEISNAYVSNSLESHANCYRLFGSRNAEDAKISQGLATLVQFDIGPYIDIIYDFAVKKSITTLNIFDNVSDDENIYSNIVPTYRKVCENLYSDVMEKVNKYSNPNNVKVILSTVKSLDSKVKSIFFAVAVGMKVVYAIDTVIPREFVGIFNKYVNNFFISKYGMLLEDKLTYLYNLPPVMLNVTNKVLNFAFKKNTVCDMIFILFDIDDLNSYSKNNLIPPSGKEIMISLDVLMKDFTVASIRDEFNLTSSDITKLVSGHNKIKELLVAARDGLIEASSGKDADNYYSQPPTVLNSIIVKKDDRTYLAFCKSLDFKYHSILQNTTLMYKALDTRVANILKRNGKELKSTIDYTCTDLENSRRSTALLATFTLDDLYLGNLIDLDVLFERSALTSMCYLFGKKDETKYSKEAMTYLYNLSIGTKAYRSIDVNLDMIAIYMLSRVKTIHSGDGKSDKIAYESLTSVSSQNYLASALYSNIVSIFRESIKPCYDNTFVNLADFKYFDITNSPTYNIVSTEEDGLIRNDPNRDTYKFSRQISIKDRIRCGKEGIPDIITIQ